jgi:hypothetical protein
MEQKVMLGKMAQRLSTSVCTATLLFVWRCRVSFSQASTFLQVF